MRGRKPKPLHLRVLEGSATAAQAEAARELQPPGELQAPPHYLDEVQKDLWRVTLASSPPGLLRNLDQGSFARWVVMQCQWTEWQAKASLGPVVKDPGNGKMIKNPYVKAVRDLEHNLRSLESELGFSPASRTRVKIDPKAKPAGTSPFGDLRTLADD